MSSPNYEPAGLAFFDVASGREMKLVYGDPQESLNGWIVYKHPDGQWVTLRKATEDDHRRLDEAGRKEPVKAEAEAEAEAEVEK